MLHTIFPHPISVAILYFVGTKHDDEDTLQCVKGLEESARRLGHQVRAMAVVPRNWQKAVRIPGDIVFNLVEDDTWVLYTKVGQRLEQLGRAQVGHDRKSFQYTTKKARIKRRMKTDGIATPDFRIFNRRSKIAHVRGLRFPVIVKPSHQHAGIGISQDSVVIDQGELEEQVRYVFTHYPGEVVAEEYIQGREIHVTLLGNGRSIQVLPYCEIEFKGEFKENWDVYTYEAKWDKKSWEYWDARVRVPAGMSRILRRAIKKLAIKAYKAFGCKDIARLDIRVDEKDRPFVVDINMSPSLNYYDDEDATLASAYAKNWTYDQFIETILAITYNRVYGHLPTGKGNF